MSGPIRAATGTLDGVSWSVPAAHSLPMIVPGLGATVAPVPSYYDGPLPYKGDFQKTALAGGVLVIEFDKPIKQFRTTAKGMRDAGLTLFAVVQGSDFVGDTFTSPASAGWNPNVSGTRTLTYAPGFKFVVFKPQLSASSDGSYLLSPAFLNTFFFEELEVPEPFVETAPLVAPPAGSGRTVSYHWPRATTGVNDPPSAGVQIRPALVAWAGHWKNHDIGAQAGNGQVAYRGKRSLRVAANDVHGRIFTPDTGTSQPYQMFIATLMPSKAVIGQLDDIAWWMLDAVLAFENPDAPIPLDVGIGLYAGAGSDVRGAGAQAGIQFGLRGPSSLGLTIRTVGAGAIAVDKVYALAPTFDIAEWHRYRLSIGSADFGRDAVLKVTLDEVVLDTFSWGADTVLPAPTDGTNLGYTWAISNRGGSATTNRMYIAQDGVTLAASALERGLF